MGRRTLDYVQRPALADADVFPFVRAAVLVYLVQLPHCVKQDSATRRYLGRVSRPECLAPLWGKSRWQKDDDYAENGCCRRARRCRTGIASLA